MELRHLRTFEMVAACGSFSRAADSLDLTQPAVSAQVQALERELGLKLLDRLPRRALVTPPGEVLLGYARQILNLEDEAARALAEMKGLEAGTLRIGASPTVGSYLLPGLLGEFRRLYPGLRAIAEIAPSHHVADTLSAHALDVGLVEAPVASADLLAEAFRADEVALVVPAAHPWAARRTVRPEELAAEPLVSREPGSGSRRIVEERLRAVGVELTPALELGGIEAIKKAVLAGLGVAFVSRCAIQLEEELGLLAAVSVEGLDLRRPLYCLRHRHRHVSPALKAFLDYVMPS